MRGLRCRLGFHAEGTFVYYFGEEVFGGTQCIRCWCLLAWGHAMNIEPGGVLRIARIRPPRPAGVVA